MKKFILALAMLVGITGFAEAQKSVRVAAGLGYYSDVVSQTLEVGGRYANDAVSVLGETYNDAANTRQYNVGAKYQRYVPVSSFVDFVFGGAGKISLGDVKTLTFEPGAGVQFNLAKNVGILATLSSPIADNSTLFKPVRLAAGTQLVVHF